MGFNNTSYKNRKSLFLMKYVSIYKTARPIFFFFFLTGYFFYLIFDNWHTYCNEICILPLVDSWRIVLGPPPNSSPAFLDHGLPRIVVLAKSLTTDVYQGVFSPFSPLSTLVTWEHGPHACAFQKELLILPFKNCYPNLLLGSVETWPIL